MELRLLAWEEAKEPWVRSEEALVTMPPGSPVGVGGPLPSEPTELSMSLLCERRFWGRGGGTESLSPLVATSSAPPPPPPPQPLPPPPAWRCCSNLQTTTPAQVSTATNQNTQEVRNECGFFLIID